MITKAPKPKSCRVCKTKFTPFKPMATCCGPMCALDFARSQRGKAEKVAAIRDRKETKAKLETHKKRSKWIAEAQTAFNTWVRLRDAGMPCICCGRTKDSLAVGGTWDAGHYRSRGSAPHLRFDERNVHAQLKYCNRHQSGNVVGYRLGLIERIGLGAVEALEADQAPRKHSIDNLKAIKAEYTVKAKALNKKP